MAARRLADSPTRRAKRPASRAHKDRENEQILRSLSRRARARELGVITSPEAPAANSFPLFLSLAFRRPPWRSLAPAIGPQIPRELAAESGRQMSTAINNRALWFQFGRARAKLQNPSIVCVSDQMDSRASGCSWRRQLFDVNFDEQRK